MEINFSLKKDTLTVGLSGEIDHHVCDEIRTDIDREFARCGAVSLNFDFSSVTFMDSSGIGMIMGRYKNIRFAGGTVLAVRVNERIRRILTLSGVYKYIDIYEELPKHSEVF